MKKFLVLFFSLAALMMAASCVVVVKKPVARWAVVNSAGADVIKVWGLEGMSGATVTVLQPGTRVKILRIRPNSVLIELPGGATGWVNRKHFGADLIEY